MRGTDFDQDSETWIFSEVIRNAEGAELVPVLVRRMVSALVGIAQAAFMTCDQRALCCESKYLPVFITGQVENVFPVLWNPFG